MQGVYFFLHNWSWRKMKTIHRHQNHRGLFHRCRYQVAVHSIHARRRRRLDFTIVTIRFQ